MYDSNDIFQTQHFYETFRYRIKRQYAYLPPAQCDPLENCQGRYERLSYVPSDRSCQLTFSRGGLFTGVFFQPRKTCLSSSVFIIAPAHSSGAPGELRIHQPQLFCYCVPETCPFLRPSAPAEFLMFANIDKFQTNIISMLFGRAIVRTALSS